MIIRTICEEDDKCPHCGKPIIIRLEDKQDEAQLEDDTREYLENAEVEVVKKEAKTP